MIGFYHENEEYGCFSNWYPAEFDYVHHFANSEQFMMYHKVIMFQRYDLADQIMQTTDPAKCKKIAGQKFPEFNGDVWEKTCYTIVKRGEMRQLPGEDDEPPSSISPQRPPVSIHRALPSPREPIQSSASRRKQTVPFASITHRRPV